MGLTAAGAGALALVAAFAGALQTSPAAAATAVPPKVTSAFTPNLIGVGGSVDTALSFTITNPNATGTLSAVSFTDTLPSGVTLDNPVGTTVTNSSGTCTLVSTNAAPGSGSVTNTQPISITDATSGSPVSRAHGKSTGSRPFPSWKGPV